MQTNIQFEELSGSHPLPPSRAPRIKTLWPFHSKLDHHGRTAIPSPSGTGITLTLITRFHRGTRCRSSQISSNKQTSVTANNTLSTTMDALKYLALWTLSPIEPICTHIAHRLTHSHLPSISKLRVNKQPPCRSGMIPLDTSSAPVALARFIFISRSTQDSA